MKRVCALFVVTLATLVGCAAPYDDDGEAPPLGSVAPAASTHDNRPVTSVVVDTDLGGDDLVALTFLLRHPDVRVKAVTIAATGLVACDRGVDLVAGLFAALKKPPVPVACGRSSAGPDGMAFPADWRAVAEEGTGISPAPGTMTAEPEPARVLIAELAKKVEGLVVVALGPLTNLADLVEVSPRAYARLAGVHAMAGSVDGPLVDGVAEWNAAADPDALAAVLAGPAPLTLVPEDAVPAGTPDALGAPVVRSVAAATDYPKWWDLATAAALVVPDAGAMESGAWILDESEPGRLRRSGEGHVRVYRSLDARLLDAEYAEVFATQ